MVDTEDLDGRAEDELLPREECWYAIKACRSGQGLAGELTLEESNLSLEACNALLAQELAKELEYLAEQRAAASARWREAQRPKPKDAGRLLMWGALTLAVWLGLFMGWVPEALARFLEWPDAGARGVWLALAGFALVGAALKFLAVRSDRLGARARKQYLLAQGTLSALGYVFTAVIIATVLAVLFSSVVGHDPDRRTIVVAAFVFILLLASVLLAYVNQNEQQGNAEPSSAGYEAPTALTVFEKAALVGMAPFALVAAVAVASFFLVASLMMAAGLNGFKSIDLWLHDNLLLSFCTAFVASSIAIVASFFAIRRNKDEKIAEAITYASFYGLGGVLFGSLGLWAVTIGKFLICAVTR